MNDWQLSVERNYSSCAIPNSNHFALELQSRNSNVPFLQFCFLISPCSWSDHGDWNSQNIHMTYKTYIFVFYLCVWGSPVAWRRYLKPSPPPGRREPWSGSLPSYRDSETAPYSCRWDEGLEDGVRCTSKVVVPCECVVLPDNCCSRCVYCTRWVCCPMGECCTRRGCYTRWLWFTRRVCHSRLVCCNRRVCFTMWLLCSRWMFYWTRRTKHYCTPLTVLFCLILCSIGVGNVSGTNIMVLTIKPHFKQWLKSTQSCILYPSVVCWIKHVNYTFFSGAILAVWKAWNVHVGMLSKLSKFELSSSTAGGGREPVPA